MYVKIIGKDTHYNVLLEPFTTQHGKNAVRFTGDEIPTTDKGFMLYDDNDTEIGDLSRYKFEYRQNEYSDEQDVIEPPSGNNEPLPPNSIDVRMRNMSAQISAITPYTQTKKGYYGETEKVFYGVPQGNVTVFCDAENTYSRIEDRLIVKFTDALTDTVDITIMVQ
jgi:hypothetical protein